MPRSWCFTALVLLVASGCGGGSTSTTIPRTNAQTSTVTVLSGSIPAAGITVTLSTGISGISPTGVLTSMVTDTSGSVTFPSVPITGQVCASALLGGLFAGQCRSPFPPTLTLRFDD